MGSVARSDGFQMQPTTWSSTGRGSTSLSCQREANKRDIEIVLGLRRGKDMPIMSIGDRCSRAVNTTKMKKDL